MATVGAPEQQQAAAKPTAQPTVAVSASAGGSATQAPGPVLLSVRLSICNLGDCLLVGVIVPLSMP